jgi:hypothetical protein
MICEREREREREKRTPCMLKFRIRHCLTSPLTAFAYSMPPIDDSIYFRFVQDLGLYEAEEAAAQPLVYLNNSLLGLC